MRNFKMIFKLPKREINRFNFKAKLWINNCLM